MTTREQEDEELREKVRQIIRDDLHDLFIALRWPMVAIGLSLLLMAVKDCGGGR